MIRARKRFGQHFLTDKAMAGRVARAVAAGAADRVVEIGPGRGAITQALADSGCELTLIEIDRDLAAALAARFPKARIINRDVMLTEVGELGGDLRIVGNLPYNISTPLLFKLFAHAPLIRDMHFMLQREVVARMIAAPSGKSYGRLSVMTRLYCTTEKLFDVPPAAFSPRPRVHSAMARLLPRRPAVATDRLLFEAVLTTAFSARRKTLRNALKSLVTAGELQSIGLDPDLRPENLTLDDFLACTRLIGSKR